MKVPSAGPRTKERARQIARLRAALTEIEHIPPHQRENQCADVRARSIRQAIHELENGYAQLPLDDPLDELFADSPAHRIMKRYEK